MAAITPTAAIPAISIAADCLPQAWEKAVLADLLPKYYKMYNIKPEEIDLKNF